MFVVRATYHTTLKAMPMQLVFGRDATLDQPFSAGWEEIRHNKQKRIAENNRRENSKRIPHQCKEGDLVLMRHESLAKHGQSPYEGPYKIRKVFNNGTVALQRGAVLETLNIRQIKPYKTP